MVNLTEKVLQIGYEVQNFISSNRIFRKKAALDVAVRKAEEAKEHGGSHALETDRQKEGCGTILWRDFIQLERQRGYNQQAKGQRNYDL